MTQPKRWFVPFPEKKALTGHPCQDACNGNQKMGYLLNYFLSEASWELERQELDESCKVVKFTRSHEHILKRVNISEKSLIQFLKQFNAWNFVLSEQYGKEFTVQAEPIQKAMYTPVITKRLRGKSCTSTSENTTTSNAQVEVIESCKVYFLHEKVEAIETLQLYNFALEARIQALSDALETESCKVVELQEKVEAGKLYNSALNTWIEAVSQALKIPSPIIDSGIDRDLREIEEESEGEQEVSAAIAPSLPLGAAPSSFPIANSNTTTRNEEEDDALVDTRALPNVPDTDPAPSALDREWQAVGEVPGGMEQEEIDEGNAPTVKMAAIRPSKQDTPPSSAVEPGRSAVATPGAPAYEAVPTQQDQGTAAFYRSELSTTMPPPVADTHRTVVVVGSLDCACPRAVQGSTFPQTEPHEQEVAHTNDRALPSLNGGTVRGSEQPPPPTTVALGASPPRTIRATVVPAPPQVLVVAQQFASVEEWKQGQDAFVDTLRGIWKTASPDFKKQAGNWNGYYKQYLDRWLKANPDPANVQFTASGKALFDEWCSLFKVKVDAGKANIEAANWLAEPCTTWATLLSIARVDVLRNEKDWLYTNDKKGYFNRGVKLFDLKREFEGWQSYQQSLLDKVEREKARPANKHGTVSGLPRLEPSQEWLEAMGGR